jgi:hypothetical protein
MVSRSGWLWRGLYGKSLKANKNWAGKSVLIVGSAPTASLVGLYDFDWIVAVNASSRMVEERFGLTVNSLVISSRLLQKELLTSHLAFSKLRYKNLIPHTPVQDLYSVMTSDGPSDPEYLGNFSYSFYREIGPTERKLIVAKESASSILDKRSGESQVSTGGFAIALAARQGATRIQFTGFNLLNRSGSELPNLYYSNQESVLENLTDFDPAVDLSSVPRNHSVADAHLISAMVLRGIPIYSNESDFQPLLTNWGATTYFVERPTYARDIWKPSIKRGDE